jgi:N-methylhydantoinase A
VHLDRARAAIETRIARPLGLDAIRAAAAMVDVVNAGMAAALRIVSVERGYDPREFALVAFGGGGPVHAARLAQELGIRQVVIPPIPGGFSALGLVSSDIRRDSARTFYTLLTEARPEAITAACEAMEVAGREALARAGVPPERREFARLADLRYRRQAYELTVPMEGGTITAATLERLAADFHDKHRMTYGHASPGEPVQMVNLRVSAMGRLAGLALSGGSATTGQRAAPQSDGPAAAAGVRPAYFRETGVVPCPVLSRGALVPGIDHPGPLIVEAADTTIVVPPGWRLRAGTGGFIMLEAIGNA